MQSVTAGDMLIDMRTSGSMYSCAAPAQWTTSARARRLGEAAAGADWRCSFAGGVSPARHKGPLSAPTWGDMGA
jgi:hypothetical protein